MDKVIKNFQNISYGPAPEDSKEVNSWIKNLKNPNNPVSYTHLRAHETN